MKTLFKKAPLFILSLGLGVIWLTVPLRAVGPPNPGESVLIISVNDAAASLDPGYDITVTNDFISALNAVVPAPTITQVTLALTDIGIYNDLVAQTGQTSLSNWCQVYDLRFLAGKDNIAYTGPNEPDVITFTGANNDTLLYTNYLNQNGHLFMQGEHHDFYIRDENLFAFINSVAATPINIAAEPYADYNAGNPIAIGGFPATPATFNTSFNNIAAGTINAAFPGGIAMADAGSGEPIGGYFTGTYYGTCALCSNSAYAWMSNDLNSNGRLVVSFETNAYVAPNANATSTDWIQNVYQLLSGCYKYTLTKAFVPTQLCVGEPGTFTLCYNNASAVPITNVDLWDTIPACLNYVSDSLGTSTHTGQVYNWAIPSIAAGASACVTVNFTVGTYGLCP